ncbi:MAG: hypothetical protein OXN83_03680 [Oligoflexia bacterium]|nr:hypothetical protein [Oligoflexia bacterium]
MSENKKRVPTRLNLKQENSLKLSELMTALKQRGFKKEHTNLIDLIIDELFLKADNKFYEELLKKFTPLEYLFKTKINDPAIRKEMEKLLKRKA